MTKDKIEEAVQNFFKLWPDAATHPNSNGLGNWLRKTLTTLLQEQKEAVVKGLEGLKEPYLKGVGRVEERMRQENNMVLEAALTFVREQV